MPPPGSIIRTSRTIHWLGEAPDGQRFIAMEYVEGETLGQRLGRSSSHARSSPRHGIQVASGLSAAHGAGVVHTISNPRT